MQFFLKKQQISAIQTTELSSFVPSYRVFDRVKRLVSYLWWVPWHEFRITERFLKPLG